MGRSVKSRHGPKSYDSAKLNRELAYYHILISVFPYRGLAALPLRLSKFSDGGNQRTGRLLLFGRRACRIPLRYKLRRVVDGGTPRSSRKRPCESARKRTW